MPATIGPASFSKHMDHKIEVDYGRKGQDMEFTIWCLTCQEAVSTTLVVKRND